MATEIERRFIVTKIDPDVMVDSTTHKEIQQGYFVAAPGSSLRVRIVDDRLAFITFKGGIGMSREELEMDLILETAKTLISRCPYRLSKTRYMRDGWEIDKFHGPLDGLVLAEYEMESVDQVVKLPKFIREAREVTDSLTNVHLAKLAFDLAVVQQGVTPIENFLPQRRVERIVLTGAPCSGKTESLKALQKDMGDVAHFVPEVATIVIAQVGARPNMQDAMWQRQFQRVVCQVQRSFETISDGQAALDGKRAMVLDRGVLDSAAFLDGGLKELEQLLHTTRAYEFSQYDRVIHLLPPPRTVYEKNRKNNAARSETYEEACSVDDRLQAAWNAHPDYHVVEYCPDWTVKVGILHRLIREKLGRP